jgi:pilus assembly protein CpaB
MKLNTLILLLVAVFVGGTAAYLARTILAERSSGPQTTLVVAKQRLAFGTELTEDNVREVPWTSVTSAGAFESKSALFKEGRRVALGPMEPNEPVLVSRITGPGQKGALSAVIGPGMRAVTVRVDDVRGVAGFVTPGDRVDIVLTREDKMAEVRNTFADVLLQNVKVLAVDQLANTNQDQPSVAKAVTLEVTTEQAQKVALAEGVGTLSLVLRQLGAANPVATRRVNLMDLGQGEVAPAPADPPPAVTPVSQSVSVRVFRGGKDGFKEQDYSVYPQEARLK